jgi:hypothetical protein
MAEIQVVTEQVRAAAARLGTASDTILGAGVVIDGTSGSAAGTTAAGAYDALVGSVAAALVDYCGATRQLADAANAAAACYEAADRLRIVRSG